MPPQRLADGGREESISITGGWRLTGKIPVAPPYGGEPEFFWTVREVNVTKLRKAGSPQKCGAQFFVTFFKIMLDKYGKMCGLFANHS